MRNRSASCLRPCGNKSWQKTSAQQAQATMSAVNRRVHRFTAATAAWAGTLGEILRHHEDRAQEKSNA